MIRSLQKRFVRTAMLSLLVLLTILIGGITAAGYLLMERSTDAALAELLADARPPRPGPGEQRPMFGYQIAPTPPLFMSHFTVLVDEARAILSIDAGFHPAADEAEILGYAEDMLAGGKESGKIGAYKYRIAAANEGGYKIVFLDVSVQAQTLGNTLMIACLIGLLCIGLMFVILMLVSRRTVQPIADSIEKQRRFVTDAGHEIKTPLAIIQANTDAMELHTGPNKWSKHIREQTVRLDGLMRQLLSLSKLDESSTTLPLEQISLSELAAKSIAAYAGLELEKKIEADIAPHVSVQGSSESLEQLLSILLDNAMKYSETNGSIKLKLAHTGKKALLEVVNTCAAVPDADPHLLFDRFYRADAARTQKGGGYGIGLSIAQVIVAQHKGSIVAYYDDEHTVRFRVEL